MHLGFPIYSESAEVDPGVCLLSARLLGETSPAKMKYKWCMPVGAPLNLFCGKQQSELG